MAIIPIIFFTLLFGFGSMFSSSSSEAYSSSLEISPGPAASSVSIDAAQSMFENREPLPPCDSWQCLQSAANQQGNGAELVRTSTTIEGDQIITYYRVHPGGELEIFTDSSQDKYLGNGDPWTYDVCLLPDDVRQGCSGS